MGRLIVVQFITLDGVVEDPDGRDGTAFGGWAFRFGPEGIAGDKFHLGDVMTDGTLLLGRITWEAFSKLWPFRDNEFAQAMNAARKAVVTHRPIDAAQWANSAAVAGELVPWVRETLQTRDIAVIGSGSVVAQLADADLVDEYRLITFPDAVGAGRRLFPEGARLTLQSAEATVPGVYAVYNARG